MNVHLKVCYMYLRSFFPFHFFSVLLQLVSLPPFFEAFVCVYTLDNIFCGNCINFHPELCFPRRYSGLHLYGFLMHAWQPEGNKSMKMDLLWESSFLCEVISALIKLLLRILETMCTTEKMQLFTMTQCNTATLTVETISILQITFILFAFILKVGTSSNE